MNTKINDFIKRSMLAPKSLGAPAFILYITDNRDISLYTAYLDTSTNIFGIYTDTEVFSTSITNKTIEQLAAELDATNFPAKILPIAKNEIFNSSDYIRVGTDPESLGTSRILSNFTDRTSDGGFIFRLKKHSVKNLEESILRLLPPTRTSSLYPWHARVQNGIVTKEYNGVSYLFYIAEYDNQDWSIDYRKPYDTIYGEKAELITDRSIKVSRGPIHYESNNIFIDVDGMAYSSSNIKDVDIWNSIIYTEERLPTNKNIYVTYTYKKDFYLYKDINLNPTFKHNFSILNTVTLFYMIPAESQLGIKNTKTIFHVTASSLKAAINLIPNHGYPILILGAIISQSINNKDGISLIDTRTRGGGVDPEYLDKYLKEFEDLNFLWDVNLWDGIPYPGSASAIYSVPQEKYELYDIGDLKNRVSKFLSPGVVVILDQVDNIEYTSGTYTNRLPTLYNSSLDDGSFWCSSKPIIINSYTGLSVTDLESFDIENNIVSLSPNEYIVQKYIKTSAPSIIKYKKRISEDGIEYSSWQTIRESRKNNQSGFLFSDYIMLGENSVYSQYKDIDVSVAHTFSYNHVDNLYTNIKNMISYTDDLYTSGRKTKEYVNLLSGDTSSITWNGVSKYEENIVKLYADNNFSGHIVSIADTILNDLYEDASGNKFPKIYTTTGAAFPAEPISWTKTAKYLLDLYIHTSGSSYLSGYNAIVNSVITLNPYQNNISDLLTNASGTYLIPDKYYYVSGLWKLDTLDVFNVSGQYTEVSNNATDIDRYLDGAYVLSCSTDYNIVYYAALAAYSAGIHFGPAFLNGMHSNTWYYTGSPFTVSPAYTFDYFGKVLCKNHYYIKLINDNVDHNLTNYTLQAYNQIDYTVGLYINDILEYCTYIHPDILYLARSYATSNTELAEKILLYVLKNTIDLNGRITNSPGMMYTSANTTSSMNNSLLLETIGDMLGSSAVIRNYSELIYKQINYLYNRTYGFANNYNTNYSDNGTILNGLIYLYDKWLTY